MDLSAVTSFFDTIPLDWIVLAALFVVFAFDALRSGTARLCALSLALPLTLLAVQYSSSAMLLGDIAKQFASPLAQAMFVAVIFALFFILLYRITDRFGSDSGNPLQALLAAAAAVVIFAMVWLQIPALDSLWQMGEPLRTLLGATYRFWLFIAAFAALAFARG